MRVSIVIKEWVCIVEELVKKELRSFGYVLRMFLWSIWRKIRNCWVVGWNNWRKDDFGKENWGDGKWIEWFEREILVFKDWIWVGYSWC